MFVARTPEAMQQWLAGRGHNSVAIGTFDGVHKGHQALLRQACAQAKAHASRSIVLSFEPHPAKFLRPEQAPALLEPLAQRLAHFEAAGIDAVLLHPFDANTAGEAAEDFVRRVLQQTLAVGDVTVGEDFVFGHKRRGNIALLRSSGATMGFAVHAIEAVYAADQLVSSSAVRAAVMAGDLPRAKTLLGRDFALYGPVVHGLARGRTLGYPTANVAPQGEVMPPNGVYAARATGAFGSYTAAVSIGVHPTFEKSPVRKVEAYLLDYPGDSLYEQPMALHLQQRLRGEQRFDGVEALLVQMAADVAQVRALAG